MILRFYAIASEMGQKDRFLLKLKKGEYLKLKRRLIRTDKQFNKKKSIKTYPNLTRRGIKTKKILSTYTVYGVLKEIKIENIAPLNLKKLVR